MGSLDKLLEDVNGIPLLRERALTCLSTEVGTVRVVLPPDRPERASALHDLDVEILYNHGSELGMSHSLQRGVVDVDADAVLIVLADLPDLTAHDIGKLLKAADAHPLAQVLRGATPSGKPGHPVLIRKALFPEFAKLSGDTGAQPLLKRHKVDTVLVPIGAAALRDLDTPEDWAAWRAEKSQ